MPSWLNKVLFGISTAVAVAGAIVALPLGLPAAVIGVATKVVIFGTTAGVIAAKVLPGHGANAPAPAATADNP